MFKRIKVLIILLLVSWGILHSQQLSHQVMVPAAGIVVSGPINYTQTIGETTVEIIGCSGYEFTQGYQQPGIKLSLVKKANGTGVDVFPNPATDYVYVKLFGDSARKFRIDIISIAGKVVYTGAISFIDRYNYIKQIDISTFKNGFYIVRVGSEDGFILRTFKIEKM